MKRYGPLAILMAVVPLLALRPALQETPDQWALIIGINDYIHFSDEDGGDLLGAERDALSMRDVLVEKYHVPVENIRMLLSREATKAAIEEAMTEWLPSRAEPGDQITVFFAGHGSQMWDESGDEDDGLDETLVPADARADDPSFDISDDQMGEWLAALGAETKIVFLDNCSSGTGTRSVTPFSRTRQLPRDINALPKPESVSRRAIGTQEDETGFDASDGQVLEISAAQPYQAAVDAYFPAEDGGEAFHGGAFTTFLVRELWRAPADATYEEVFVRVRDALKRNRFEQDPYISEDVPLASTNLFSVAGEGGAGTYASLRVTGAGETGDEVEMAGGRVLGITPGSVFEAQNGAMLRVESVTPSRARARVVEGSVEADAEARLVGYRFPESTLRVGLGGVDSRTEEILTSTFGSVPDISVVQGENEFAHLLIRRRGEEVRVVGMDGANRHTFPAGPEGVDDLISALKAEGAAKRLADMENPAPNFGIRVWLNGEDNTFGIGESVVFHASAQRDGYLTLVDLGTDGTVTVLFPNPYDRDNRVRADQEITFPTEGMESEIHALPPAGRGMVRAFLTPQPLDIPMDDDFVSGDVLLADLIADAVRQAAGGIDGAPDAVRLEGWASASVVYDIRQ